MGLHAGVIGTPDVALEYIGREGHNGDLRQGRVRQGPNGFRRLPAVHHRHLDVHEYQVIGPWRGGADCVQGGGAVLHGLHGETRLRQNGFGNLPVDLVVLRQEDPAAGSGPGLPLDLQGLFLLEAQAQGNGKRAALLDGAVHLDAASQQLCQILNGEVFRKMLLQPCRSCVYILFCRNIL